MTESLSSANPIRLFIGELLQNKPEHDCLRAVYENLAKSDGWAYVFANFHAAGRQIDLAVFTEKTTLVIEAKGYLLPIRGSVNGLWEQIGPYGSRQISNAYNQALDAKNALRDEMQRLCRIWGYPNGR
ncbi:nuclease-related domain-containing protein [Massilia sp. GCM10023247]|uniref:nuclease-related domain-containing protein n=1 Tax=Massilia sp. GCM10023247 TaxID=3252643 RepID=UPI00362185F5